MRIMDTHEICSALLSNKHTATLFAGVLARDQFARSTKPGLYVVNTHDSDKSGEAWLVVYISNGAYDFFDSYGRPPSSFLVFQQRLSGLRCRHWNNCLLQRLTTNVCGDYCVFVCTLLARRFSLPLIVRLLLIIPRAEIRDHVVRGFLLQRFGPLAVTDPRTTSAYGLDGVHVLPLQSSRSFFLLSLLCQAIYLLNKLSTLPHSFSSHLPRRPPPTDSPAPPCRFLRAEVGETAAHGILRDAGLVRLCPRNIFRAQNAKRTRLVSFVYCFIF